mmetsp:Transcript_5696/g.22345  ORF Transcript_5696/g.22345 Transcript_5696/m.22345 type:complete len:240 (-) Transcript_5696:2513-3232(-)
MVIRTERLHSVHTPQLESFTPFTSFMRNLTWTRPVGPAPLPRCVCCSATTKSLYTSDFCSMTSTYSASRESRRRRIASARNNLRPFSRSWQRTRRTSLHIICSSSASEKLRIFRGGVIAIQNSRGPAPVSRKLPDAFAASLARWSAIPVAFGFEMHTGQRICCFHFRLSLSLRLRFAACDRRAGRALPALLLRALGAVWWSKSAMLHRRLCHTSLASSSTGSRRSSSSFKASRARAAFL